MRIPYHIRKVFDLKLTVNILSVLLNRSAAEEELVGYLRIGVAGCQQGEYLHFPFGQGRKLSEVFAGKFLLA